MAVRHRYVYEGPVLRFDSLICAKWKGETIAKNPDEAKRNLSYQFKKEVNLVSGARVTLPGKLKELEAVM